MKTILGGNSHTGALMMAQRKQPVIQDFEVIPFGSGLFEMAPFSMVEKGRVLFTAERFKENLSQFASLEYIDPNIRWGLCMGTHTGRIFGQEMWQKSDPSAVLSEGRRPISLAILDAMIEQDQRYIRQFILQLVENGVSCFVVSCPPPREDHFCLSTGVRPETVLYIDQRARKLYQDWLANAGVPFVDYPRQVLTPEGFLKPALAQGRLADGKKDPHHANARYGSHMLLKIRNEMGLDGLSQVTAD
ncbi:MAG: hypothetical protein ABJO67_17595 [Pseudoruegeria sp.]